jgi:hypothetical protein
MNKYAAGIAILIVALVLIGCPTPTGQEPTDAGGPADLIRNMPSFALQLPKSLAAESGSPQPSVSNRALGDVEAVDPAAFPAVKAEGWGEIQQVPNLGPEIDVFVEAFKDRIPSDYEAGTIAQAGVVDITAYYPQDREYEPLLRDLGTYVITGDGDEALVKWFMTFDDGSFSADYYFLISLKYTGSDYEFIHQLEMDVTSSGDEVLAYSSVNTSTGESVWLVDGPGQNFVMHTGPHATGGVQLLGYSVGSDGGYVAWGNDAAGGLLTLFPDSGTTATTVEVYDGTGDLVRQMTGTVPTTPSEVFDNDTYKNDLEQMSPLRRLLPITGAYSSWELLRKKGKEVQWTNRELNGMTSWSEIDHDYTYFLDNPNAGTVGELDDEHDIELSEVAQESHWNWDPTLGDYRQVRAPIARFTGDLPSYYSFADGTTVASIQEKLEELFINELPLDYDAFFTRVFDLRDDPEYAPLK